METVTTELLEIGYEAAGPTDGKPVIFGHGWPDDARTWKDVVPRLASAGFRTYAPYVRGFGPTRFLSSSTVRDGHTTALAQDMIDFASALSLRQFSFVGHDWGGRTAYTLAALFPERLRSITSLSVPFTPHGEAPTPDYEQSRLYWYQWFMNVDKGGEQVRKDPKGFARDQWEHWSPKGWFTNAEFEATAKSFENPDHVDIVLSSYRSRWNPKTPHDERYDALRARLEGVGELATPTLVVHGTDDSVTLAKGTAHQAQFFKGPYERVELPGIGHFVAREAPEKLVELLVPHLKAYA